MELCDFNNQLIAIGINKYEKISETLKENIPCTEATTIFTPFNSSLKPSGSSSLDHEEDNIAYLKNMDSRHNLVPNSTRKFVGWDGNMMETVTDETSNSSDISCCNIKSCMKQLSSRNEHEYVMENTSRKSVRFHVQEQEGKKTSHFCQIHTCTKCKVNPELLLEENRYHDRLIIQSSVVPLFAKRLRSFFTMGSTTSTNLNDSSASTNSSKSVKIKRAKFDRSSSYCLLDDADDIYFHSSSMSKSQPY